MSTSTLSSPSRAIQKSILLFVTAVCFIFFARFLLLFIPLNVLWIFIPFLEWLGTFASTSIILIFYFTLAIAIFSGGVYALTRLYHLVAKKILGRSIPAFAVFVVLTFLLGILLWPMPCDTHESFFDTPNKRCDCIGWTFEFYPPFVFDGASTDYCMGWEVPVEQVP